jgi:pimeloyl-ACP methyl ester carboxylesterase
MNILNEIKKEYITLDGLKLHVATIGNGPAIILLHGFPDFWYGWKNIIQGLKNEYRLIIPDLRGYNLSDKPTNVDNYRMEFLIKDITDLADILGIDTFFLAGHDWGGVIAWCFAEKYPERVKKLMILNAPHPKIFQERLKSDKAQQRASFYIFEFLKPQGEKFVIENDYKWLKKAVFEGIINQKGFTNFDKNEYLKAWAQPGAIIGGVNYYRANTTFNNWTGYIKVPTIVIHGMKDVALLPSILDDLSKYVQELKIIRAENASHWILHDEPDLVVSTIRDFFI